MSRALIVLLALFSIIQSHALSQDECHRTVHPGLEPGDWSWIDGEGCLRLRSDLDDILASHDRWLRFGKQDTAMRRANIDLGKQADLTGARLHQAHLPFARLEGAILRNCVLSGANLESADLDNADLIGAVFSNCRLIGASLKNAKAAYSRFDGTLLKGAVLDRAEFPDSHFNRANLTGARFVKCNLKNVNFDQSDLSGADLTLAEVTGARLGGANLTGTVIDKLKGLPDVGALAQAKGLGYLQAGNDLGELLKWRKLLKETGFHKEAKHVNASIWRNSKPNVLEKLLDLTCGYGANTWRPLGFLACIWILGGLLYCLALFPASSGKRKPIQETSGLYRITKERGGDENTEKLRAGSGQVPHSEALMLAFLFSAIASFSVGYREFNFAPWIRGFFLPWNADFEARGWVRRVATIQSFFGFCLIALTVLSFLATPFER